MIEDLYLVATEPAIWVGVAAALTIYGPSIVRWVRGSR